MNVDDPAGQRRLEYPCEIVAVREAQKDRSENQDSHSGEKNVIVTPTRRQCPDLYDGIIDTCRDCGHVASLTFRMLRER